MLDLLFKAFAELVAFFYRVIPSYGVAIILLTVAVRLVLFPLTAKQAKSMQAMQRVQPELKRLQQKYKNDRQKLNEEMMKFYKENQINPLAGCLPLLLQLPLFIVLYRVIAGLTHTVVVFSLLGGAGAGTLSGAHVVGGHLSGAEITKGVVVQGTLNGADVQVDGKSVGTINGAAVKDGAIATAKVVSGGKDVGSITDLRVADGARSEGDPKYLRKTSELYKALQRAGGRMVSWGVDLSKTASHPHGGFGDALPYYVLVALTVATGYYQQRQMTAKNPQSAANPQAQMMGKIFPVMFGFISLNIAAGVVVYFIVSNIWQIGQQAIVFNPRGGATGGSDAKPPAPPKGQSGDSRPAKPNPPRNPRRKGRK